MISGRPLREKRKKCPKKLHFIDETPPLLSPLSLKKTDIS